MSTIYISPKQFETAMMEINIAFEIVHSKMNKLQERVAELEAEKKATKTTTKTNKS